MKELAARLKAMREGKGFTSAQAAKAIECHPNTVLSVERAHSNPTFQYILAFSKLTGYSLNEIAFGEALVRADGRA